MAGLGWRDVDVDSDLGLRDLAVVAREMLDFT